MRPRKRLLLLLPPLLFFALWAATVWLGKPEVEREIFEREIYVEHVLRGVRYSRGDYRRLGENDQREDWSSPFYRMKSSSPFPLVVIGECATHWDAFGEVRMQQVYFWFFGKMVPFEARRF